MIEVRESTKKKFLGLRFGRLTIVEWSRSIKGRTYFKCLCDCGNFTETGIDRLKSGVTTSCGCVVIENNKQRKGIGWDVNDYRRNPNSRLYGIHRGIMNRCFDSRMMNYHIYGGRGITICEEWKEREIFIKWALKNGYNKNLSIDRIDNDGNYEPTNCRWATCKQQSNNNSRNKLITYNGETLTHTQWSEKMGYRKTLVNIRIKLGWSDKDAIETPPLSDGYTRSNKVLRTENPPKIGHYVKKSDRI